MAEVGAADQVGGEVRRKLPGRLDQGRGGLASAVRAPTVVVRGGDGDGRPARGGLRTLRVVAGEGVAERGAAIRARFSFGRRAGLRGQRVLQAQVDDPAERVRAVERGGGAAEDLDRGEAEEAVAAEFVGAGEPRGQATSIQQHGGMGRVGAADEEGGLRSFAALFGGDDARRGGEERGQRAVTGLVGRGDVELGDGRGGLGGRGGLTGFDHHGVG